MRVVVVDDDPEAVQFVADALIKEGYDVVQITQADGILARLTEVRPDLVILDVMYPDNPTFGFELARSIRRTRHFRQLPIVLQTGLNRQYPLEFSDADIDPEKHALLMDLLRLAGEAAFSVMEGERAKDALHALRSAKDATPRKSRLPLQMLREAMMQSHELPRPFHAGSAADARNVPLVIRIIADLIVRNSHLPFTLRDVADVAKMTPAHLSSLFRKHMGTSFVVLLTDARIENAKKLLRDLTLSIGEVARTAGFDDTRYFSRRFKQQTGLTPRAWREQKGRSP